MLYFQKYHDKGMLAGALGPSKMCALTPKFGSYFCTDTRVIMLTVLLLTKIDDNT